MPSPSNSKRASRAGEAAARRERPVAVDPAAPDDLLLEYTLEGRPGAPVVMFLHGITGSRRYFYRRVRHLAQDYRLFLPDLPGFGDSPKPRTAYNLEFYRQTVRNTIEVAGLQNEPVHIVGHSLGALIAVEYAVRHPEHVDRLALLSVPRFESARVAHEQFWKGSPNYRRLLNEHSMTETIAQWKRTGWQMAAHYAFRFPISVILDSRKFTLNSLTSTLENCLLNYRVDPVVARLGPRPTLLMHGRQDQVAPLANIAHLPGQFGYMRLVEIPDSGHHIFLTHARICMSEIEAHLAAAGPGAERPGAARPGEAVVDAV